MNGERRPRANVQSGQETTSRPRADRALEPFPSCSSLILLWFSLLVLLRLNRPRAHTNLFPSGPFVSFVFLGRGKVKLLPVLLPLMLLLAAFARSRPATVFVIPVVTCGKKDPASIYGITFPWISSEGRVTISGRSD